MQNRNSDQPKIMKGTDRDGLVLPTMAFNGTMKVTGSTPPPQTSPGNLLNEKNQPTKHRVRT